jgi:hypothetical protein
MKRRERTRGERRAGHHPGGLPLRRRRLSRLRAPLHVWPMAVPAPARPPPKSPEPKQLTRGRSSRIPPPSRRTAAHVYFTSNRDWSPTTSSRTRTSTGWRRGAARSSGWPASTAPIDDFALSPDGRRIAFTGVPEPRRPCARTTRPTCSWRPPSRQPAAKNLTAGYDFEVGEGPAGRPARAARGPAARRSSGAPTAARSSPSRGRARPGQPAAVRRRRPARRQPLTDGSPRGRASYTAGRGRLPIALVISTPTAIGDLHALDTAAGEPRTLVAAEPGAVSRSSNLTEPEEIDLRSFDGKEIHPEASPPVPLSHHAPPSPGRGGT